ncbi:CotD family spore coat protein [Oceanobacillus caeni]|uniref:CotD family spore coat protein n=1 Tax=Oceanobacillus caeni TaxID=405946 RepID=UPI00195F1744|nr:CotD family spore coat protein [Oceanobacillus caeni]MBU8790737.1 spore coat protein [Oceanobacillus caeni]
MRRHHGPHCGCPICVYPTKVNNVHTCSESCVKHIHPSHTNVINHHTVKNIHEFPHSTSFHNVTNSVDIEGPSYEVPGPGPGVMGASTGPGFGPGPGVMGAPTGPGFGPGPGVMGAFDPGYGHGKYHGHGKHHPHHCGCKR